MPAQHILLAILVSVCWGANFVAAKIALEALPPFLLLMLRFGIVAALIVPFSPRLPVPLRPLLILSMLLGTMHFSMMFGSIWLGLDVSSAIIATQLGVPFSCLLGSILFKDSLGRWRSFGMLVSFAGVVVIAGTPQIVEHFMPFLIACVGALAWAGSNILLKHMPGVRILPLLGWLSLLCAPQLLVLSFVFETEQWEAIEQAQWTHWLALSYTVLFSTIVAYGLWYWLLSRYPVSLVTPFSLLVPVFGFLTAQWFFAEPMTTQFMIGGALTLLGVGVILFRKPKIGLLSKS